MTRPIQTVAAVTALCVQNCIALGVSSTAANATAPPIRTSARNPVPACVSAARLGAFLSQQLRERGHRLRPEFQNIAHYYELHGRRHRVRWDYAFFQMALETNFLSFRRGDGKPGDVRADQNNFAGLGTTGGGVPGDHYPDVSTGVLAQIQHLVVYSGERLRNPVGHRTRLKQDVILQSISRLARSRPVTFADLARRWAADRHYGRSIERLAGLFYKSHCHGPVPNNPAPDLAQQSSAQPLPAMIRPRPSSPNESSPKITGAPREQRTASVHPAAPPSLIRQPLPLRAGKPEVLVQEPSTASARFCTVEVASFGGERAVLIESVANDAVRLTALNVQPGFEAAMAANFIASHAPNGRTIGAFDSRSSALSKAHDICRLLGGKPE